MNFQICRPAVSDPPKVRPCNTQNCAHVQRIIALPHYEYLLKYADLHLGM